MSGLDQSIKKQLAAHKRRRAPVKGARHGRDADVSRILFPQVKRSLVQVAPRTGDGHSSGTGVATGLKHATRPIPRTTGDCLRLHAVGFAVPRLSPAERCALTAPFHPYRRQRPASGLCPRRSALCCTFPGSATRAGGCYPPPCPAVFGLSSAG